MSYTVAGGNTTFVKNFDATGRMQFEFSRAPESFPLVQYCAMRKVKRSAGYYLKADNKEASRVVDPRNTAWADGASGLPDNAQQVTFSFLEFLTNRDKQDFTIGYKAVDQADFDVVPLNARAAAQRAMTIRSIDAQAALLAASWGANTASATTLGGGKWNASSSTNQYILKTFNKVKQAIWKTTQGAVSPKSLTCVVSPAVALSIRESPEIINFIQQQVSAPALISEDDSTFFQMWGLPRKLYGVTMVVEDAVRNQARKGETDNKNFTISDTDAFFLTNTVDVRKESDLPPGEGVALYDTLTQFVYEDMTVENMDDPNNRRIVGRVVNDWDSVVTCPESGYYVSAVT